MIEEKEERNDMEIDRQMKRESVVGRERMKEKWI